MDYNFSSTDNWANLEDLYNIPVKIIRTIKVAGIAIFLSFTSLNANATDNNYNSDIDTRTKMELIDANYNAEIKDGQFTVNLSDYKLTALMTSVVTQQLESLTKLYESFFENFEDDQGDIEHFQPLFIKISNELKRLKIDETFVDISRKKNMIDFNLNLEEELFLSVASSVDNTTDEVMFSVARNHKTLVIDIMPLSEVVDRAINVLSQLKNVARS